MQESEDLNKEFLQVIENQLNMDKPPITKFTLNRLLGLGIKEKKAKQMLVTCVQIELHRVITEQKEFDVDNYTRLLNILPNNPYED